MRPSCQDGDPDGTKSMAKGETLRDRTAAAIIDSATALLAERGDTTSMEDIATTAGVGRATLYRYFPNRDALLKAMALASIKELGDRITHADLDNVPFEEAVARLVRCIVSTGSKYIAVSRGGAGHSQAYPDVDAKVAEPIRALFRRGLAEGALRKEIPADLLFTLFTGLVRGALDVPAGQARIEETAASITTLFLHGATNVWRSP